MLPSIAAVTVNFMQGNHKTLISVIYDSSMERLHQMSSRLLLAGNILRSRGSKAHVMAADIMLSREGAKRNLMVM